MNSPQSRPAPAALEREIQASEVEVGTLAVLQKAEIDIQIATAHRFPRSVTGFRSEAEALVTLNEAIAEECFYSIERDDKMIEGPSSRFAEVVAHSWGNCRAGARVIDDSGEFVTAQGVFHDLQKNVFIAYEVKRRIVGRSGRRYSTDMIGVTANAACSIALRNAILKGVPKALWNDIYETAKRTAMGDYKSLSSRRTETLATLKKFGVLAERVFEKMGVKGEDDLTIEHVFRLRAMTNAIKDGDSTPEEMFPSHQEPGDDKGAGAALKAAATGTGAATEPKKAEAPKAAPAEPDASAAAAGEGKKKATTETLERYLGLYAQATTPDKLEGFALDAGLFEWTAEDKKALDEAYRKNNRRLSK